MSAPFDYIHVSHSEKRFYDFLFPSIFAILTTIVFVLVDDYINFVSGKFFTYIGNLFGILTGFFVASLAAVATFQREDMDVVLSGVAPVLKRAGKDEELTKRRYLSLTFSYLSLMSIGCFVLGVLIEICYPAVNASSISPYCLYAIKLSGMFLYSWLFWHINFTMLVSFFFLTDSEI